MSGSYVCEYGKEQHSHISTPVAILFIGLRVCAPFVACMRMPDVLRIEYTWSQVVWVGVGRECMFDGQRECVSVCVYCCCMLFDVVLIVYVCDVVWCAAKSGRSGCKKCKDKIAEGALRIGKMGTSSL